MPKTIGTTLLCPTMPTSSENEYGEILKGDLFLVQHMSTLILLQGAIVGFYSTVRLNISNLAQTYVKLRKGTTQSNFLFFT